MSKPNSLLKAFAAVGTTLLLVGGGTALAEKPATQKAKAQRTPAVQKAPASLQSKYEALRPVETAPSMTAEVLAENPSAPQHDPSMWGEGNSNLFDYNCYAYAMQASELRMPGGSLGFYAPDFLPDGGGLSGGSPEDVQKRAQNIIAGAEIDGAKFVGKSMAVPSGYYMVGFYLLPPKAQCDDDSCIADYHFAVQGRDGKIWHKAGSLPPKNVDSNGNEIADFSKAVIQTGDGRTYVHVGNFLVPQGGLKPDGTFLPDAGDAKVRPYQGEELKPTETIVVEFTHEKSGNHAYLQREADGHLVDVGFSGKKEITDAEGKPVFDPQKITLGTYGDFLYTRQLVVPNASDWQKRGSVQDAKKAVHAETLRRVKLSKACTL